MRQQLKLILSAVICCAALLFIAAVFQGSASAQISALSVPPDEQEIAAATSTPRVSDAFVPGEKVYPISDVKVRARAGLDGRLLGTQASGTPATIIGEAVSSDNLLWWSLDYDSGVDGWTVEEYLKSTDSNPEPAEATYSPAGEVKITSVVTGRSHARIDGDKVVWADGRNGGSDIYLFDLTTNAETRLTGGRGIASNPSVSGNRVAYLERAPDPHNPGHDATQVYVHDLTAQSARLLDPSSTFQSAPVISGDTVAYVETANAGERTIVLHDLISNAKTPVASGSQISGLTFNGNHLAWIDSVNGVWKVFSYDVGAAGPRTLFDDPGDQMLPAISSDGKVVFAHRRSSGAEDWHVYLFDPATGGADPITKGAGIQPTGLAISGNFASWVRGGEVYLYDLSTHTEQQMTNLDGERSAPALSGNTVVWIDGRNGGDDVFLWRVK